MQRWKLSPIFTARRVCGILIFGAVAWESSLCAADPHVLPVPSVTIYPGTVIKDTWLVDHEVSVDFDPIIPHAIDTRAAVVGKVARRTLLPGSPIPLNAVAEPKVVSNGAKVKVLFEEGGLAITTYGTALQAGSVGDLISIRNLGSGLIISGTVQTDGSVRVGGS